MVRRGAPPRVRPQPAHVDPPPADAVRNLWQTDTDACCAARKVEPLQRALAGKTAWITGLRRADSPSRADAPIVHVDPFRDVTKINPMATWSDEDVAHYNAIELIPAHPLTAKGYASIGCWPCTRPVKEGEDARAGRWSGSGKTECGLHLSPGSTTGGVAEPSVSPPDASDGVERRSEARPSQRSTSRGDASATSSPPTRRSSRPRAARCCSSSTASISRTTATSAASGRRRSCRSPTRAWSARRSRAACSSASSGSPSTASPRSPTARCGSRRAQGVQYHFVHKGELRSLVNGINAAALSTLAACGDVVRNVMACPWPDDRQAVLAPARRRPRPAVPPADPAVLGAVGRRRQGGDGRGAVRDGPESVYGDVYLPRKFKIAVAWPGDNCVDVHSNDVGLVPTLSDGYTGDVTGYHVLVGGGIGLSHARDDDTYPRARVAARLGAARPRARRRRGGRRDAARLRQPRGPPPRPAQVPRRRARHRLAARPRSSAGSAPRSPIRASCCRGSPTSTTARATASSAVPIPSREDHRPRRGADPHGAPRAGRRRHRHRGPRHGPPGPAAVRHRPTAIPRSNSGCATTACRWPTTCRTLRRLAIACPALPTCGQALGEAERVLPALIDELEKPLADTGAANVADPAQHDRVPERVLAPVHGRDRHRRADEEELRPLPRRFAHAATASAERIRADVPLDQLAADLRRCSRSTPRAGTETASATGLPTSARRPSRRGSRSRSSAAAARRPRRATRDRDHDGVGSSGPAPVIPTCSRCGRRGCSPRPTSSSTTRSSATACMKLVPSAAEVIDVGKRPGSGVPQEMI